MRWMQHMGLKGRVAFENDACRLGALTQD